MDEPVVTNTALLIRGASTIDRISKIDKRNYYGGTVYS